MQNLRFDKLLQFKRYAKRCALTKSDSRKNQQLVSRLSLPVFIEQHTASFSFSKYFSTTSDSSQKRVTSQSWSKEWERLGLGARLPHPSAQMTNLLFVQTGFGVDQHGDRSVDGATKAAVRAVRNAIEFNSIPGVIESVPGGRNEMLIKVKLGVPALPISSLPEEIQIMDVDLSHVAKVFPYGRLMPIDVVVGGLSFPTGRVVPELGDKDDEAICVVASVQIGYDDGTRISQDNNMMNSKSNMASHKIYNTDEGY